MRGQSMGAVHLSHSSALHIWLVPFTMRPCGICAIRYFPPCAMNVFAVRRSALMRALRTPPCWRTCSALSASAGR